MSIDILQQMNLIYTMMIKLYPINSVRQHFHDLTRLYSLQGKKTISCYNLPVCGLWLSYGYNMVLQVEVQTVIGCG